jgi:hypothetical protein
MLAICQMSGHSFRWNFSLDLIFLCFGHKLGDSSRGPFEFKWTKITPKLDSSTDLGILLTTRCFSFLDDVWPQFDYDLACECHASLEMTMRRDGYQQIDREDRILQSLSYICHYHVNIIVVICEICVQ